MFMSGAVRGRASRWRLLTIVAVVLGVLGMHGLASGHHTTAPLADTTAVAAGMAHGVAASVAHVDTAMTSAAHLAGGDDCAGMCEDGVGLAALCVAVLAAVAVAMASGTRSARLREVDRTRALAALRPRRTAVPRAPDLVAELCTSRT